MANIRSNDIDFASAQFQRISPKQCEKLHNASLEILERTGVRLFDQDAVDLLKNAGAFVSEGNRVRIPASLVEKAFNTVPRRVVLCDRYGKRKLLLEGRRSYYGPGSDCLNIIDHRTNERRQPSLQDVFDGMVLCDALPHIDFVMSLLVPADVNSKIADRYQMEAMLTHTTKPIIFVTYEFSGCVDAVEMAEAVVGGPEALRQNPLAACYINVTTGLIHNQDALQKLLYMAGKGLPVLYIPVVSAGMTGPVTPAASMAMVNAGTLTGLVLSQLKREGAPYIVSGWGGEGLDMATMFAPYFTPNSRGMATDLAHFYNLPSFSIGGVSEANLIDAQTGAEAALLLLIETLAGGNLIHDLGYLEAGLTFSFTHLLICNEIVSWLEHVVAPVKINDETLCLDLIDEAGPDGQYIKSRHTREHYRERWYPSLFERTLYGKWEARGGKSVVERAAEKIEEILTEHKVEPLPDEAAGKIRSIIQRAEEEFSERK